MIKRGKNLEFLQQSNMKRSTGVSTKEAYDHSLYAFLILAEGTKHLQIAICQRVCYPFLRKHWIGVGNAIELPCTLVLGVGHLMNQRAGGRTGSSCAKLLTICVRN